MTNDEKILNDLVTRANAALQEQSVEQIIHACNRVIPPQVPQSARGQKNIPVS